MAKREIREKDVQGLKYFDQLAPLLERLHEVGCERDRAGNRELHMDHYCMLVLLFFFNPVVDSLRGLQQASELKRVQKRLGCGRASLGSLSESVDVFEPERLREIIAELGAQLAPIARDSRLKDLKHTLTLVDGTVLKALPSLAEASLRKRERGKSQVKWRLHTHFEVDRHVPVRIDARRDDQTSEREMLEQTLQPDRCYAMDRGYPKFQLFNRIHAIGSSYVCRIRDNSHLEILEDRPLSEEDRQGGVLQDALVRWGHPHQRGETEPLDHAVRVVFVQTQPHPKRSHYASGSSAHASDGVLRIVTDLLDVPAWVIALIYRYRWTIEIFFRFFKHLLGCRHLLSNDPQGIALQTYSAVIACMLLSLWTGRKPTKRTYEMICWHFIGLASEEELLTHLTKLQLRDAAAQKNG